MSVSLFWLVATAENLGEDPAHRSLQRCRFRNETFLDEGQEVAGSVQPRISSASNSGLGSRGMTADGFLEQDIEVVERGLAGVVLLELVEHLCVPVGAQNAFQDHVVAVVERITSPSGQ
jgi:hypothetical protein